MGIWMEFMQDDSGLESPIMICMGRVMAFYPDYLSKLDKTWVVLSGDSCALFCLMISYQEFKKNFGDYIPGSM